MVQLAQGAAFLADRFHEADFSGRELADLRCRAWVELGNAYRVAEELDRAQDALDRATAHFLGSEDEFLGARFFTVSASLFAARRLFKLACSALDFATTVYQRYGEQHLAGRALIKKGIFTGYGGDAEKAVLLIRQGLSFLDEQREPGLVYSSVQAEARFLVDCGRLREARVRLWSLKRRRLDSGGRVNELKVRWLEGQIFVGLNQLGFAENALKQVKQGFEEAGLHYKAALAGLELGAIWLRQGRLEAAEDVVLQCTSRFLSLRVWRELLASILVLRKATEKSLLTLPLLYEVIDCLHKLDSGQMKPPTEP